MSELQTFFVTTSRCASTISWLPCRSSSVLSVRISINKPGMMPNFMLIIHRWWELYPRYNPETKQQSLQGVVLLICSPRSDCYCRLQLWHYGQSEGEHSAQMTWTLAHHQLGSPTGPFAQKHWKRKFLTCKDKAVAHHHLYSLDLAPCNIFLFPRMKFDLCVIGTAQVQIYSEIEYFHIFLVATRTWLTEVLMMITWWNLEYLFSKVIASLSFMHIKV